ncbi:hypothetical protein JOB18_015556 [Solea senegalensis]|nr:TBC1 domain family member 2A isoform X1 [Solea senegalensis]XP_043874653.1 TBC1 domain family member 2A isoform X1 [Solea senegalensis]KAG7454009.1 hypothetical protein JOB18_015556 [Solea senegalensis]KAG7454014.1 hypothetical protein JOB18_015556 [Solea senegalensis]
MDQSNVAGNPETMRPPSHPDNNKETRQTAKKDQQSTGSGTSFGPQNHHSPAETQPHQQDTMARKPEESSDNSSLITLDPGRPDPLPTEQHQPQGKSVMEEQESEALNQPSPGKPPSVKPESTEPDPPVCTFPNKPGDTCLQHKQNPDLFQDHQEYEICIFDSEDQYNRDPSPFEDQQNQDSLPPEDQQNQDSLPPEDQQNQDPSSFEDQQNQDCVPLKDKIKTHDLPSPEEQQDPSPLEDQQNQDPLPPEDQQNRDPSPENQQNQDSPPSEDQQTPSSQVLCSMNGATEVSLTPPTATATPLTPEAFSDKVQPVPWLSSSDKPKLCGFLQKQGGPLRVWKQRWFTYEEKKNQLFYYRTPQDVMPLGRVELSSATFTYPLRAETGTFHIKTPERTFILKAVTEELMLYWLQQLQVKRWQHRQMTSCPEIPSLPSLTNSSSNNNTDDFLPALKSPLGLVGEEAANASSQPTLLANMSIKHPLIQLQNSVHFLRKRSSHESSQSVFHVETPAAPKSSASRTPLESPSRTVPLADPAVGGGSPSLSDSCSRRMKNRSSSTMPVLCRDTLSSTSEQMSRVQQEKEILIEEVKAQKELVWILHKALEASQLEKRACAEFLAVEGEQKRLELLRHRERQAADLQRRLEEVNMEAELLRRSLAQRDALVAELQEHIEMLTDKNNAKQEVIIKLSDQVTACLSIPPHSPSGGLLDSETVRRLQQENGNLKDDIEAYKTQNKFLNSEIYQLTRLWRKSSEQEKCLMIKCAYLEARNCQGESRYLGVLRKLQETKSLDPVQLQTVHKLIEEALKGELKESFIKLNTTRDHDEYGFKIVPDYEIEDMKLLAKIQALEIRSHNLLQQDRMEHPLLTRWAQYLAGRSRDELCPSPELKTLLRCGVPQEYRQRVWSLVVRTRTRTIRDCHPQHYQELCDRSHACPHPVSRQIQLDLHRTLTTNQHFSSPSSPALQQLRRILLAFSWHNPVIGYCQGLNRLAALALLVLQNEEESFWCLVAVVESIMPQDYYTKNLLSSQADQRVLKDFLVDKLPRLASHFDEFSIDVSLITFNWFLVVFVENLPSDILLPLWDAFLYEGSKVMFRYALALFKYKEDDILKIHDSVEIYQYLRFFTKTICDSRRLTSIAFNDMNPFPGRLLKNRRTIHQERLEAELRQLEEQQREYVRSGHITTMTSDPDTMVSEDDDDL